MGTEERFEQQPRQIRIFVSPMSDAENIKLSLDRIERLDQAIKAQRQFLQTIPDPDTRYRAEGNLMDMIMTVEALRELHEKMSKDHG